MGRGVYHVIRLTPELRGVMSSITLSTHQVARVSSKGPRAPWYLWFGALAVTSASIGGAWDVSWHRSIGRDTFWTPAHLAISGLRHNGGHHLRLPYAGQHLRGLRKAQGRVRQRPRLPRSTRCVHRRMGRHRHAHLRPVRQLVARRLRPRRQNRQPTPHAPHPRHPSRIAVGVLFLDPRRNEPRHRRRFTLESSDLQEPAASLPLHRRPHRQRPDVLPHGVHLGRPAALGHRLHLHGIALPLSSRCCRRPRATTGPLPPPPPST